MNHSCEPSEVSSSLGYASFSTSPPASPPLSPNQEDSAGSNDDCQLTGEDYGMSTVLVEESSVINLWQHMSEKKNGQGDLRKGFDLLLKLCGLEISIMIY